MFVHRKETGTNFSMKNASPIKRENNTRRWKYLESSLISSLPTVNLHPDSYSTSLSLGDFLLSHCDI